MTQLSSLHTHSPVSGKMLNENNWNPQKRERCEAPPSSHPLTTHFLVVLVMVALHQTVVSSGPRTLPNLACRVCRGFSTPATYSDGLAGTCRQRSTRLALNKHPPLLRSGPSACDQRGEAALLWPEQVVQRGRWVPRYR